MRSAMRIRTTVNSPARAPSAEDLEHVGDLSSPCITNESSCFKENINLNKSETPKLCLEPLQMKRKKKGGGYNLRKSLAWDKAFFSEEGVLDPVELSIISGTSCREGLPFINGESLGSPQLQIKPLDLKKLENDGQMVWSSPKIDSSSSKMSTATSLTSHKFPTPLADKSGSRCGDCPRPLPPSSLKRPANVNVGKAAGKDLKLPKVPGLKPSCSPICATPTNTILQKNCVKHNQIAKPDFNIQRNPGSKNFPKSHQNNQSASTSLRPVCYSDEISNLQGNPSSKRLSSVNMSPVLVDNTDNSGSKMISDIITSVRPVTSSETQQKSTSFAVSSSSNAHVSGMTLQPLQNHPMKPSGLRMPSPSLSFFSQPKQSVFQDLRLRDKETDICKSQKHENSWLLDKLRRPPKINRKTPASAINISKAISSSSECMVSSHASAVDVIKPKMDQKHMHKILDISKNRSGGITREDVELQKIDIEFPSESGRCEQIMDDKFVRKATEGYLEEVCITDYHKSHREQTDPTKDSLGETDKDKNVLSAEKRTSEHLGVSQLNGSCFRGSASTIALKHSRAKAENSDFESNHVPANLLNRTVFTEVSTDILMGNVAMENTVLSSSVGDCRNDINLTSKVDDDTNKSRKEMDPPGNAESNTSDRLLPEKQSCLRNPQQEKHVEKLISVVPYTKDGKNLMDTKTASSPCMHDCNFDEDKMTVRLPVRTECNFVNDPFSSESHCSLVDVSFNRDFKGNTNYLSNNSANKNLSNSHHQDTERTEIDYCSSFPENRSRQGSQENTLGKVTETSVITHDGSADIQLTSNMAFKESESSISLLDLGSVMMQSSEINMLNECCADDTELLTLPSGEFVVEHVGDHNHGLHFENAKESKDALVTGQTELYLSTSRSTSFSVNETPLRDENCNDACGIRSYTADVIADLSRVEPFSETSNSEVSEDTNGAFSFLHLETDHTKAEAAVTPNKKNGDDLNDKSRLCLLPSNAIPFSDEWLAAIEAAGEDILTKKSGAVQNSPPDKSLPEPGPWSPVKRKNNQIGPFDCTKCTTVPSDSG